MYELLRCERFALLLLERDREARVVKQPERGAVLLYRESVLDALVRLVEVELLQEAAHALLIVAVDHLVHSLLLYNVLML